MKKVLAEVAPLAPPPLWRRPLLWTAPLAFAALLLIPLALRDSGEQATSSGGFNARGSGAVAASLVLLCAPARAQTPCQSGDALVFDITATADHGFFAAFAQSQEGTVIWYFPESPGGESMPLDQATDDGLLRRQVQFGAEHTPGHYRVYGIFSQEPLTRAEIKARFREDGEIGGGIQLATGEFDLQ